MTEPMVLWAGVAVWAGIGAYLAFLAISQRALSRRLAQLELLAGERD